MFSQLFAQTPGASLFDSTRIVNVYLNFEDEEFWSDLLSTYSDDYYMECSISIDGISLENVGIKLKGNSSFGIPTDKKPFKIEFDEFIPDQFFDGLEKLVFNNNFKDPTMLREKLFYDFCKHANIPAPRANFARVYMNDEYWGLYTMVDEIDKKYLNTLFSDNDGNLFKGDPSGDLVYYGDEKENYSSHYELKTNEEVDDWTGLIDLIDRINNTTDEEFYTSVSSKIDDEDFYNHWAVDILFSNLDSYLGSGHNYYLYHEPESDEYKFIFWDANEAFGNFSNGIPQEYLSHLSLTYLPALPKRRPIIERALENDSMFLKYLEQVDLLIQHYFNPDFLFPIISEDSALIANAVYEDSKKQYSFEMFENNVVMNVEPMAGPMPMVIPGLKQFITERNQYLLYALDSLGYISSINHNQKTEDGFKIFPTFISDNEQIHFFTENQNNEYSIEVVTLQGIKILEAKAIGDSAISLNKPDSGIFYLILSQQGSYSRKICQIVKL